MAFAFISFLHIVLGELAPKSIAIRRAEAVALNTALPLYVFYWAMYPFIVTAAAVIERAVDVNDCIQRLLDGTLDAEVAYMAKWWCTEQQFRVTDECLQLFGGYGYMAEYPIARMYADARVQKIVGGANEVMKDLIARRLLA